MESDAHHAICAGSEAAGAVVGLAEWTGHANVADLQDACPGVRGERFIANNAKDPSRYSRAWQNLPSSFKRMTIFITCEYARCVYSILHSLGNEKTQSRTPPMGKNLHHRRPSSGPRLPNPAPVPAANFIPTKGVKSVTHLLVEPGRAHWVDWACVLG
jgi:hypothetical protein